MALGQGPQALLTTLYRSTDCLCRRGAAMKNLAQSASPHAGENNAPLKPGTKHLMPQTWNRNARMAGRRLARRHSRRTFRASEGCCPPAAASPILAGMAGYGASDPAAPNAGAETVNPEEIGRFAAQSAGWWDPEGSFRPLHRINPV